MNGQSKQNTAKAALNAAVADGSFVRDPVRWKRYTDSLQAIDAEHGGYGFVLNTNDPKMVLYQSLSVIYALMNVPIGKMHRA